MNLADLTQVSVKDFAEELGKVEIKKIEIPKFFIPNWPKGVVVSGHLGKKDYCVPVLESTNLLGWKTDRQGISFRINSNGAIVFKFHGMFRRPVFDKQWDFESYSYIHWVSSDYKKNLSRLATLILFDKFKVEMLVKILALIESTVPVHNQVVDAVMKAFEPFIPFVVADQLS